MLKPIKSKVLLKLIEKEKTTESGIILTKADSAEVNRGTIISIGEDVENVEVGQTVLPNWNAAIKTKYENVEYYLVDEDEIVLIFED